MREDTVTCLADAWNEEHEVRLKKKTCPFLNVAKFKPRQTLFRHDNFSFGRTIYDFVQRKAIVT